MKAFWWIVYNKSFKENSSFFVSLHNMLAGLNHNLQKSSRFTNFVLLLFQFLLCRLTGRMILVLIPRVVKYFIIHTVGLGFWQTTSDKVNAAQLNRGIFSENRRKVTTTSNLNMSCLS